jgi:HK97 gp10 family phage protein
MMQFSSLLAFSQHLIGLQLAVHHAKHGALEQVGKLLKADMIAQIGHYQPQGGGYVAWASLAPSTESEKAMLGAPADAPLERFGDLKQSFKYEVEGSAAVIVGSTDPVMVYHELGTSRMPPRPVIGPALYNNRDKVQAIMGRALVEAILLGQVIP